MKEYRCYDVVRLFNFSKIYRRLSADHNWSLLIQRIFSKHSKVLEATLKRDQRHLVSVNKRWKKIFSSYWSCQRNSSWSSQWSPTGSVFMSYRTFPMRFINDTCTVWRLNQIKILDKASPCSRRNHPIGCGLMILRLLLMNFALEAEGSVSSRILLPIFWDSQCFCLFDCSKKWEKYFSCSFSL